MSAPAVTLVLGIALVVCSLAALALAFTPTGGSDDV